MKKEIPDTLSVCGVYCIACPSYNISCLAYHSKDKGQKRISKWKCRLRTCALEKKGVDFCVYCDEFPCKLLRNFADSHKDDPRYGYRAEVIDNLLRLKEKGLGLFIESQKNKWECPECGGVICFYYYGCRDCGYKMLK